MRIVHISDWHGTQLTLPEADLYVSTGDMIPNFPFDHRDLRRFPDPQVERRRERQKQEEWALAHPLREMMGSPDAPVVCVRGNHDFADARHLFVGCSVIELLDNEVHEVLGMRVTGHRGIPYIGGYFSDEVRRRDLIQLVRVMPVADLYLTHYPPFGVMDSERGYGLDDMAELLVERHGDSRALHCFGHIHECGGGVESRGNVTFSNAATTINVIEVER